VAENYPTIPVEPEEVEEWRAVPEWPAYQVSNLGRVRSVDRVLKRPKGRDLIFKGRVLSTAGSAYPQVNLNDTAHGRSAVIRVHILVLIAFVGPRPPGMECRHLNDVKTDCRLVNLAWGTSSQNHGEDRRRNGRLTIGSRHGMARLNEQAVLAIRYALRNAPYGRRALVARLYGVSDATVADALSGRCWTHVGGPVGSGDRRLFRE
jgi:hypothetical protein